jgi:hypothetical protein
VISLSIALSIDRSFVIGDAGPTDGLLWQGATDFLIFNGSTDYIIWQ